MLISIHFLCRSSSTARTTIPATWPFNHFIRMYFEQLAFHWPWFSFFCGCPLSGEERGAVESLCIVTGCQRFSFTVTVGRSETRSGFMPFFWSGLFYRYVSGCFYSWLNGCTCIYLLIHMLIIKWVLGPVFHPFSHLCQILCHCSFRMVWTVGL